MLLRARYVIPVEPAELIIKHGAVRVKGSRIAEVGPAKSISGQPIIDFGDAVILPGFVNAHTHLELTDCAGRVPPSDDFTDWLFRLLAIRLSTPDPASRLADAAREGMLQSLAHGVTTAGDITSRPDVVRPALRHGTLRVVSFGEVIAIGSIRDRLGPRLQSAVDGGSVGEHLSIGVSPHAPYTIETEGITACVEAAHRLELPLCMHLCETPAERAFTERGEGSLVDYLKRLNVWDEQWQCPRLSPMALAHACGVLGPRTVLAHCNDVNDDDLELLARTGTHVAYCPQTHAAFGHRPHRFREMLDRGINVCAATDSLASNPSLSVLEEIRFLHERHPQLDPHILLEMATIRGARALGLAHETATLAAGKRADLAVIPVSGPGGADAVTRILESKVEVAAAFANGTAVSKFTSPKPR